MRTYLTITLTLLVTVCCIRYAYLWRGYFAVGGEWMLWIVPLLGWIINKKAPTSEGGAS